MTELTAILDRLRAGDPRAAGELFDRVYAELRRMAAAQVAAERAGHTLNATALVHEAYLRLFPGPAPAFADRAYFFAAAASAMRRVRVDHARARGADKRGGGQRRVELDSNIADAPGPDLDLVALDEALDKLAAKDPARAKLVELRFFAGLTMPQVAEVLGVSLATAERHWAYARAWLLAELQAGEVPRR
ncbi:MAG TPA: ECF-type sigma factor [Gemmataceae bacterium]|nr:ECF-type sigma factor [Gemmataceae bacterium]